MKRHHTVRPAAPGEGIAIAGLMDTCGMTADGLDWSDAVLPYWYVVERDRRIIGAIQVSYGRPWGRLEAAAVDPELESAPAAAVYRDLVLAGIMALRAVGAGAVLGFVPFDRANTKKFLKKFGGQIRGQGNLIELRLAREGGDGR